MECRCTYLFKPYGDYNNNKEKPYQLDGGVKLPMFVRFYVIFLGLFTYLGFFVYLLLIKCIITVLFYYDHSRPPNIVLLKTLCWRFFVDGFRFQI